MDDSQQMQSVEVPRLGLQNLAIELLGLRQLAHPMKRQGVIQQRARPGRRGRREAGGPLPLPLDGAAGVGFHDELVTPGVTADQLGSTHAQGQSTDHS